MAIKSFWSSAKLYLSTIWHNRRHFKLQIFGVMVLFTVTVFIINFISIKISYNNKVQTYLDTNVQYTSRFQMSLTGVEGSVERIFVDRTKTKCFILLSFDNTTLMTLDAKNYGMFLTNSGKGAKAVKENIKGEIYMFGVDGLVGLYLQSDVPFENQTKSLVLRNYNKLTTNTSPYYVSTSSDAKYDQAHIYFNPGGLNSQTIAFLENHTDAELFSLTDVYRQVYSVNTERQIRSNINECYTAMLADMNKIIEYQNRLRDIHGVQIPDFPYYINGDNFENVTLYDADGNATGTYLKFKPATVVPGGTDFDWYNGSILTSYFRLVPNRKSDTIRQYQARLYNDSNKRMIKDPKYDEWYYADGTLINTKDTHTMTSAEYKVYDTIVNYEDLLKHYVDQKKKYQAEYLPSLLTLEQDSDFSAQVFTIRNDAETLVIY